MSIQRQKEQQQVYCCLSVGGFACIGDLGGRLLHVCAQGACCFTVHP